LSRRQNTGQNYNLLTANTYFEIVAKFKYLGRKITNQNCVHEEIKSRLNSRNADTILLRVFTSLLLLKTQRLEPYIYLLLCNVVKLGFSH